MTGLPSASRVGPIGPRPSPGGQIGIVPAETAFRSAPAQNDPPRAVQHRHRRLRIGVERQERVVQRLGVFAVDGVAHLGTVERHQRHRRRGG